MMPAKVVLPVLVPTVSVLAPSVTVAAPAEVKEATDCAAPKVSTEVPVPSKVTAVRPLAVGRAFVTFAFSVPLLRMKVGPL